MLVGASERVPVGQGHVRGRRGSHLECCSGRVGSARGTRGGAAWGRHLEAEVGASERVPVGQVHVRMRGEGGHLEGLQWAHQNGCLFASC